MAEARQAYHDALETASDDLERCRARIGLAAVKRVTEDLQGAFSDLEQAEAAAVSQELVVEQARIHFLRGNLYFPLGDIDRCLKEHGTSLELARQAGDAELEAAALGGLGDAEYVRARMISAHERLRACVDLCRRHGLGRIEVANQAQIAHTMLYLTPHNKALVEARAAAKAAAKVGHHRAELNARVAAMFALLVQLKLDQCRQEAHAVGALIDHLGARRFEQARLLYLGRIALAEGRRSEAVGFLEAALDVAQATGMGYHGPTVLGALALVLEKPDERRRALAEGEAILHAGCVGHNQLWFYPDAIQAALALGAFDEVERFALALDNFTLPEPLPWSQFFSARGRALGAFGQGRRDGALMTELERLRDEGNHLGLKIALPAIEAALLEVEQH
jgi:tetratricopeptide (TPR) repeat protein